MKDDNLINKDDEIFNKDILPDNDCPLAKNAVTLLGTLSKPFGMVTWKKGRIIEFLENRGYTVMPRWSEEESILHYVATKDESDCVPEKENLLEVFSDEVQNILLDWLLRIAEN
jgi:hypothetical protein